MSLLVIQYVFCWKFVSSFACCGKLVYIFQLISTELCYSNLYYEFCNSTSEPFIASAFAANRQWCMISLC